MKPSERIKQISREIVKEALPARVVPSPRELEWALPYAVVRYLDEQHERENAGVIGQTEHGDKVYGLRSYEPDPVEPEPESGGT